MTTSQQLQQLTSDTISLGRHRVADAEVPQDSRTTVPWQNADPLWSIPAWSAYVGINPDYTRQLIKQQRIPSVKIGGRVLLRRSAADDLITRGTRPATRPLNTDRFGHWA